MNNIFTKFFFCITLLLFFCLGINAQMQASHWIFGKRGHIEFPFGNYTPNIDFAPSKINSENTITDKIEGSATISDVNGNLLLYTNGLNIYNKYDEKLNEISLRGSLTSTQSSIFIPFPGKYNQYILFTIYQYDLIAPRNDISGLGFGLYYYIIDLNKNNGHGELITPDNNRLLVNTEQKLHATFHQNKKDIWVLTHFEGKFYAYLVTKDGIQSPVISNSNTYVDPKTFTSTSKGFLKISPLGNKIGLSQLNDIDLSTVESLFPFPSEQLSDGFSYFSFLYNNPEHPGQVSLFDFDNSTGLVNNRDLFRFKINAYGLEFSTDGKYLYHQYNEGNYNDAPPVNAILQSSVENINNYNTLISLEQELNKFFLQLSVNGKIYSSSNSTLLSTIDKPKNNFSTTNFLFKNQNINSGAMATMGSPNFISDYLKEEIKILNSFDGINACVNTELKFWINNNEDIISINWDFGNGDFSDEVVPSYTYTTPGFYDVTCTINGVKYYKRIQIHDYINLPNYTLKACDTNNDGLVSFNLEKFINLIGENAAYISFHSIKSDAEENINPIENLLIESNSGVESIWARIINLGGCISFTEIKFEIDVSEIIKDEKDICLDYNNSLMILTKENIESLYTEPIKIYYNSSDADSYQNEITESIVIPDSQNSITLYIKAQNLTECDPLYETTFNFKRPIVIQLEDKTICPFDGSVNYEIPLSSQISKVEWKNETGSVISIENSISIDIDGKYFVTITNQNGCEYTNEFNVIRSQPIDIKHRISNNTLIIEYGSYNVNDYLFSIDDGLTWNSGSTYQNLSLGSYNLLIKEANGNNCLVYKSKFENNILTNFLSPNNDGKNDVWIIKGFETYEWIDIQIYNRKGKQIVNKQITNSNEIWDGKLNNIVQPSDSYWYVLKTSTGEKYTGYVLLKSY